MPGAVTWGVAQTAPDGGLDIDIQGEDREFMGDLVPLARTGIQVKKSKMPAGKIRQEMSAYGKLRPIISELNSYRGCCAIVSLEDDPASSQMDKRTHEIQSRIETEDLDDLLIRFYGRNELASWLGRHVGVKLWARKKLNLSLVGWRPFEKWTATPPNADDGLI